MNPAVLLLGSVIGEAQAHKACKPRLRWRYDTNLNGWHAKRGDVAVLAVDRTFGHRMREGSLLTFAHGWAPDTYIDQDWEPIS